MTRDEVTAGLERVFRDVFDDEKIILHDRMTARDIKDWDSFNHVSLIVGAEQRFGIRISSREIASLTDVGRFIDIIAAKVG